MINGLKGIKSGLDYLSIMEIKQYINEFRDNLLNYEIDFNLDDEDILIKEYEINKLRKMIAKNDILEMQYKDIPIFLDKLIAISEFIEL